MTKKNGIYLFEIIDVIKFNFNFLLKKRIIIILVAGLGGGLGLVYALKKKPKYSSSLSFVVEGEGLGGLSSLASSFGLGGLGGAKGQGVFNSDNILDLLKSRALIEKALLEPTPWNKKISFADYYIKFKELKDKIEEANDIKDFHLKPHLNPKKTTLIQNDVLNQIHQSLTGFELKIEVKNPENSIIYIDLITIDEKFCRYFPETLINVVSKFYIESKTKKAKLNYQTIKQQTDSVRYELNRAISNVASARDNTFLLNPAFNVKRVPSTQKEITVQANTLILGELVKNLEISRMNLLNQTPIIDIIDTPILPLEVKRFGKIKGILIGGFAFGFLIVAFLIFLNYWKKLMLEYKKNQE